MCIIQGEIKNVSKTKILATKVKKSLTTSGKPLQLIVYSNTVELSNNGNPVAMVLPFPNYPNSKNDRRNFIKILETKPKDSKLFDYLDERFKEHTFGSSSYDGLLKNSSGRGTLKVSRSGSYRYSIVNELSDFNKLNNNVFKLDPDVEKILSTYYQNFGFIVCIIDTSADYSPFAYISERMPNGKIFIPTRHHHQHQNHYYDFNSNGILKDTENKLENWDHSVYILGTSYHNGKIPTEQINVNKFNTYSNLSTYIQKFKSDECKLLEIHGMQKNIDILVN